MPIDAMTRLSSAQGVYMKDFLKYDSKEFIDIEDIRESLTSKNIEFTELEIQNLFDSLKFNANTSDKVSRLERYANGHLFILDKDLNAKNKGLLNRIADATNVGISNYDF